MKSDQFREHIRLAIADEGLQAALDANAQRRTKGRLAALATLPDPRASRKRAHAVRAEVIEHLDEYLDQFVRNASANGILVHRAADADEAVKAVLEIVQDSPRRTSRGTKEIDFGGEFVPLRDLGGSQVLVAKSKSMISEEINLNHALEAAGVRVVETDLGEYIVQLRGERPAHIITPAVHLRRHQVGKLFEEKLGLPYTEDVGLLTAAARRTLREIFLTADVGISGVNFGVAATGSLCMVTNEGNGRMVTTVPPVHIALMGMERLVPTLDDLALMLSLLARSATGQKLTVYTQLINAPRRPNDPDGPRERHLILLDNGRSRMRDSNLKEALYCIRCGACLNACPVFREIGGHAYVGDDGSMAPYSGPIGSIVSPGLLGLREFGHLAQASTLCGACKEACPVDIDLPRLLVRVRSGEDPRSAPSNTKKSSGEGVGLAGTVKLGLKMYTRITTAPWLFAVSQRTAGLGARLVAPFSDWMRLPGFTGWGHSRDFPRPDLRPFRTRFRRADALVTEGVAGPGPIQAGDAYAAPITRAVLEGFAQELIAVGGDVYIVRADQLGESIVDLLHARGIDAAQMWDSVPGLTAEQLTGLGVRVSHASDPAVRAGITGALAGIAETGTIVLPGGPGQPLTASLLPEIHIAVLRASQLVPGLADALRLPDAVGAPSVAFVTGPSRTADIEMTLTIGVHGPKEVHAFLIDDSRRA